MLTSNCSGLVAGRCRSVGAGLFAVTTINGSRDVKLCAPLNYFACITIEE